MKKYVIGVDLGGTKIYSALVDFNGNIIKEKVVNTEAQNGSEKIINNIEDTIKFVLEGVSKEEVSGIGIGSPGPLDIKNGIILEPPNLPFKNFNIVEKLENSFALPVFLDNDANAATQGEFLFGAGNGTENMLFITISTGIGGGAIINGKIYRGSTSNGAEIGHTTINPNGPRCGCGNNGCIERLASGTAIMKRGREAVETNVVTSLRGYNNITTKDVFSEYYKGDRVAKEIIDEALDYLGVFVANMANSFDPDMIVLGGGVINGGDIVLDRVREVVKVRALKIVGENVKIVKSTLGGKAGVLGAAALVILEEKERMRLERI